MAWYGQKNYQEKIGTGPNGKPGPYTIAEVGCLLTSFANLLQKFGTHIDPAALNTIFIQRGIYLAAPEDGPGVRDDLGWSSIAAYDGAIKRVQSVDHGTERTAGWPTTNNAIVKFYYQSIQQPWLDAAKTKPNMITHFCLVADPNAKTIVDSWDGIIKGVGAYGQPVAWATFDDVVPQVVTPPPAQPVKISTPSAAPAAAPSNAPAPSTAPAGSPAYKFAKGDTIYAVAMRNGYTSQQLEDFNGIKPTQVADIPVGYILHFPPKTSAAPAKPVTSGYTIEVLPSPKVMHVTKAGGANRWGFGNVKTWSDFAANGNTPQNTNVTIAAVATVLIGKETAAYYMDALALGDYVSSGHVANTIGYNWSDLAEGPYVAPAPPAPPKPPIVPPWTTGPAAAPEEPVKPTPDPNAYKTSYKAYDKPKIFIIEKTVDCPEMDGRRPDHRLLAGQGVSIAGTFINGQTLYGRPTGAVKAGYWFGVPMDAMEDQEAIFNSKTTLAEKRALHAATTLDEKITVVATTLKNAWQSIKGKK